MIRIIIPFFFYGFDLWAATATLCAVGGSGRADIEITDISDAEWSSEWQLSFSTGRSLGDDEYELVPTNFVARQVTIPDYSDVVGGNTVDNIHLAMTRQGSVTTLSFAVQSEHLLSARRISVERIDNLYSIDITTVFPRPQRATEAVWARTIRHFIGPQRVRRLPPPIASRSTDTFVGMKRDAFPPDTSADVVESARRAVREDECPVCLSAPGIESPTAHSHGIDSRPVGIVKSNGDIIIYCWKCLHGSYLRTPTRQEFLDPVARTKVDFYIDLNAAFSAL